MTAIVLRAAIAAAAMTIGASAGIAADLDYRHVPPPDRYSSAYDDPRYRDIYGAEPRRYTYEQRFYRSVPPPPAPVPPATVYREHDDRAPYRGRYADVPRRDWRDGPQCVSKREAEDRLVSEGWRDFHDLELGERAVRIKARRPGGELYDLKVDRCSGEILNARLIDRAAPRPYAYDDTPRYQQPYYR